MSIDHKEEGNKYYKQQNFLKAIECYTLALDEKLEDEEEQKIRTAALFRNRCMAFFKLRDFENSLLSINDSILVDPKNLKSYLWKSQSLLELKRYDDCEQVVELALSVLAGEEVENDPSAIVELNQVSKVHTLLMSGDLKKSRDELECKRILKRCFHCKNGLDMKKIMDNKDVDFANCYGHLNFQSSDVALIKNENGVWDAIATKTIPAGELIYAGHPMISVPGEKATLELLANEMLKEAKVNKEIAKRLAQHCENNRAIFNQSNGQEKESIIKNVDQYLSLAEDKGLFIPVNLFSEDIVDFLYYEEKVEDERNVHNLRCFYDFPSFLATVCAPNTTRLIVKGMYYIRAKYEIKEGERLTASKPKQPKPALKQQLKQKQQLQEHPCLCDYCQLVKVLPPKLLKIKEYYDTKIKPPMETQQMLQGMGMGNKDMFPNLFKDLKTYVTELGKEISKFFEDLKKSNSDSISRPCQALFVQNFFAEAALSLYFMQDEKDKEKSNPDSGKTNIDNSNAKQTLVAILDLLQNPLDCLKSQFFVLIARSYLCLTPPDYESAYHYVDLEKKSLENYICGNTKKNKGLNRLLEQALYESGRAMGWNDKIIDMLYDQHNSNQPKIEEL